MKYEKAILYQPVETASHFWPKLRLDLYRDGKVVETHEDKASYFKVDEKGIKIHSYGGGGQLDIPKNGPVRVDVSFSEIGRFINEGKNDFLKQINENMEREKLDLGY